MPYPEAPPELAASPSVQEAMAFAAEHLLRHRPSKAVIEAVLERLALATVADRAWVVTVRNDDVGILGEIPAEWAAPGLPLLGADLGLAPARPEDVGMTRWVDVLSSGTIIQGAVADLPHTERPFWERIGIAALALVPLFTGENCYGFISLASVGDRTCSDEDIQALRTVGRVLGAALEQEHHRDALDASEERFRRLADNATDIIYRFDLDPEPHFSYLSPSLTTLTGFTPEECYTDPGLFLRQVHPDDGAELAVRLADPGTPGEPLPLRWTARDGRLIWLELRSIPVSVKGRLVAIEGIARDVTRQQELSHALGERVKELTCLAQVRHFVHDLDDVADVCRRTTEALASAMQWPDLAGARVQVDGGLYSVGPVDDATLFIAPITAAGRQRGSVLVGYDDPSAELLPEEQQLAEAVATILGSWLEQSETAAALAESEARFRRLLDNAPDIVYRYRLDENPGLEYISLAVEHLTGHTAEEHLEDPVIGSRFIHPDDQQLLFDQLGGSGTGEPFLVRFLTKDGRIRWTEHRRALVRDEDGLLIATEGVARDVTERVEATGALERRARELAATAHLGEAALALPVADLFDAACKLVAETLDVELVAVIEILADGPELVVRAHVGLPADLPDPLHLPLDTDAPQWRVLQEHRSLVIDDTNEEQGPGTELYREFGISSVAAVTIGGRLPFGGLGVGSSNRRAFSPEDVHFLEVVANILGEVIERDRADDELERSERQFRTIAEHSPDIIVRYDRDLRHLYVNPMVERKTGIPAEKLIGRTNREVGEEPQDLIELWERTCRETFETGLPQTNDFTYPGPDGPIWFQSHVIPELDHQGDVETVLVVARDLTQRHWIEEQRRDALSRLVTAQEEERARIAADIHDDSIQIMVAAGMRLEVLKREFPDVAGLPAIARLEETVRHAISRLRSLMFELRPPELDREGLTSALRAYLETALDEEDLTWEVVDGFEGALLPDVRTVLYRIAQEALTNVRKHARASHIRVVLDEADGGVRLRIDDDGIGLDLDDLSQAGPHHLGTVTMRERAEGAGGRLDITSVPGKGTTVTVWVPTPDGREVPA